MSKKPPKVKEFAVSEGSRAVVVAQSKDWDQFSWYDENDNFLSIGNTYVTPHLFKTKNLYVQGSCEEELSEKVLATIRVNPWHELLLNLGSKEIHGDDYTIIMRIYNDRFEMKQIFMEESPYLKNNDDDEITIEFELNDALKEYQQYYQEQQILQWK
jgi:hypothetical protein